MGSSRNAVRNRLKSNAHLKAYVVSTKFVFAKNLIESNDCDAFLDLLDNSKIGVNDIGQVGGPSFLILATETTNLRLVQELLRRGADVNYADSDEWNALLIAVKEDNIDIASELLDGGADIESKDCGGFCPLMWASYLGKIDMVRLLLKRNANPNVYELNQISPLIWASGRGFGDIVQALLAHGAKVDVADKYGTTALTWAARKGHYEIVKRLLKHNANVDATGMFGWTPLIVATRGNYEEVVELILSHRPNTNANDAQGLTPLMTACKEGNINIVNLLLYHGAYVNLTDGNGDTSLIHASKAGFLPIVEALIKAHAGVDHQGAERKTALYSAVEKGHIEVIKALLKANANVELCTRDGDTPLMKAVRGRRVQAVRLLLDRKARVSPVDRYGDCALHIAARAQSRAILELLLRNPRNSQLLYRPNAQGETAFQLDAAHPKPLLPTLFGAAPSARRVLEKETQLGYDLYSSAIANLLSEPGLKTPLCVGLFAKWGSGKSFLLGRLCGDLAAFGTHPITAPAPSLRVGCGCGASLFKLFSIPLIAMASLLGILLSNHYTPKLPNLTAWFFIITFSVVSLVLLAVASIALQIAHRRYDWRVARNICVRLRHLQLLLHVLFAHPPQFDFDQVSGNPVRFLFTEQPVKLSTEHSTGQLVAEIQRALWTAVQWQHGYLTVRLFRVFKPKSVSARWRWKRVLCFVPTLWLIVALFASLVFMIGLLLIPRSLSDAFQSQPALGYVLVGMLSVLGTWTVANLLVPLHILRELFYPIRPKTREQLRDDVLLLQSCISFLDAFDAKQQTRLVIILDALESIYESDRLVSFLEAINMHYLSTKSSVCPTSPFVILLSLDPHHHVTGKSKQYLKTIVHLPFFLQNSQLRRVKIAQQVEPSNFGASLPMGPSGSIKFGTNSMQKNRPKRGGSVLKAADSVISLSGQTGEAPIKVLLTDDYFSDVNLKSMRRIMNIVYIQGRLLKAFNLDFNWHKLTTWVNITEQWPLRTSALMAFYELNENKYTDDAIPLRILYDRVSTMLDDVDTELLARDADEKKLGIFLSCNNAFQLGDLKIFSPFTVSLDPYLKRCVQQILSLQMPSNGRPSSANTLLAVGNGLTASVDSSRNRLAELPVEGVIALLRQLDGFDVSMIDQYAASLRKNNINGRVLANCDPDDLAELKKLLNFNFGDWLLFKRQVLENKSGLISLHRLAPASTPAPLAGTCTAASSISNLHQLAAAGPVTSSNSTWASGLNVADGLPSEVGRRSESRSPINNLFLNLEKQITMEETALQSDVKEDDESDEPGEDGESIESVRATNENELNVLYIGSNTLTRRMSPSVLVDIESQQMDETTPLMSPTKSSASSSSSNSSPKKRLERQKQLDARETTM